MNSLLLILIFIYFKLFINSNSMNFIAELIIDPILIILALILQFIMIITQFLLFITFWLLLFV